MTGIDEDLKLIRQIVAAAGANTLREILIAADTIDW